ncbi:MAG: hypothetical protein WDN46_09235 [Methylocella sp.]
MAGLSAALLVTAEVPAQAMPTAPIGQWAGSADGLAPTTVQAQPDAHHGPVANGHGPAARPGNGRPANGRPGFGRPGYGRPGFVGPGYGRPGYRAWVRPYRWAPGGAIAAGFAIGFLTAAAVASWAPPPPQPGMCWYYTDPSQQNGFWDYCQ